MHETKTLGTSELVLGYDYDAGDAYWAGYLNEIVARGLPHERFVRWQTKATNLDEVLAYATRSSRLSWGSAVLLELECEAGCIAVVTLNSGSLSVNLAAETVVGLRDGEAFIRERLPVREATDDQMVPISFWSCGCRNGAESSRSIAVPTWADIRGNYPSRVADQLDKLMDSDYRPGGRGQLILWYGEPGTGKTYSLRALAWQWREWCSFQYVTDPETFFGRPEYMLRVIIENDEDEEKQKKWKLLILEDTGELLAADAKAQAGQGLSRLLNIVDGIIGQGLHVIVLVTTNDDLRQLHPAVSRRGRCLAKVQFVPFTPAEAEEWLERNGVDSGSRAGTLATLFGAAAGDDLPERPRVGFGS